MSAKYLTPEQVSTMIGRAVGTLASDRCHDCGIPYYRLGKRQIRYKESDVIHFMEKKCKKVYPGRDI